MYNSFAYLTDSNGYGGHRFPIVFGETGTFLTSVRPQTNPNPAPRRPPGWQRALMQCGRIRLMGSALRPLHHGTCRSPQRPSPALRDRPQMQPGGP
jgi:hypothetical protein